MTQEAQVQLQGEAAPSLPRIGEKAPYFDAVTSHGRKTLDDYKGKWLILFSHPADFTPVCTTEFVALQNLYAELKKRNVELLGLSIDSVYSHIAWVRNIEEKLGVKIEFPIIADLDMKVAKAYGMIMPAQSSTSAVRALFVIDPDQIVRLILYYPMEIGRNMDEVLRIVDALQVATKHGVALPANWRPGDKVIVPPPQTQEDAEKRVKEPGLEVIDWYLSKKPLA